MESGRFIRRRSGLRIDQGRYKSEFDGVIPRKETLQIVEIVDSLGGDVSEIQASDADQLTRVLTDGEEEARAQAAADLGEFWSEIVAEALKQALRDSSPAVRGNAAASLAEVGRRLASLTSNWESIIDALIDVLRRGESDPEVIRQILWNLRSMSLPALGQAREVIREKQKFLVDAKGGLKIRGFEAEDVFVKITDIANGKGDILVEGISEKLKVENRCVYCHSLSDPEFYDPRYPRGAGHCDLSNVSEDHAPVAPLDGSCDEFRPNRRSSWWLHSEYMAGFHPRVSVWWKTYDDKEGLEKVKKEQ